jgi:hypothetical protein
MAAHGMSGCAAGNGGGTAMTTKTEIEIVKRYLKELEPDELVALLIDIHGADSSEYLAILAAVAGGHPHD